jgi:endonuclease/exonuclease/phosphatase family metal-dependent hydrolase
MRNTSGAAVFAVAFTLVFFFGCVSSPPTAGETRRQVRDAQSPIATLTAGAASASRDVRVMSFNLRVPFLLDALNYWGFRRELVVKTMRDYRPDVLGTQECVASVADYLREQLPEYTFVGAGRNDGKRSGEMCAIFYRTDRFDELDHGHFWLSDRPDQPGTKSWGSWFTRMATWVQLRDRKSGQVVYFFNTHLDSNGSRARLEGAKLIRARIASIGEDSPVILTGDFNTGEHSAPYAALFRGGSLVDTYRQAHPVPTDHDGSFHSFFGSQKGERIDWIVSTSSVKTVAAEINHASNAGRFPSDHFPVTATLHLPGLATASNAPQPVLLLNLVPGTRDASHPIANAGE